MNSRSTARAAVFFGSLSAALAAALLVSLLGRRAPPSSVQGLLDDPALRAEVVQSLIGRLGSVYDSHNDPYVGRVLLPNLDRHDYAGVQVSSNSYGMREHDYAVPKPEGLVRIVLLGDSLVFGHGCPQELRATEVLERFLYERAVGTPPALEVLNLAIPSWNIEAEAEFVRRQLALLRPDVVFHLTTNNDLDDVHGTRGFGEKSRFTDRYRERADARVESQHPLQGMGLAGGTPLIYGVDWEGRSRFAAARASVLRLKRELEEQGGRYVMLLHWSICAAAAGRHLVQDFEERDLASLPTSFWDRKQNWVGENDPHWNPRGMEEVAELMYGLIRSRKLIDGLELAPSEAADALLALVEGEGLKELYQSYPYWISANPIDSAVDFANLSREEPGHFHGGTDEQGRIGPYASIALLNGGKRELVVRGRGLERQEIDGLTLKVWADEVLAAELVLRAGEPFEVVFALPPEFAEREAVDARFETNDYAYVGHDLQHCVSAALEWVELR